MRLKLLDKLIQEGAREGEVSGLCLNFSILLYVYNALLRNVVRFAMHRKKMRSKHVFLSLENHVIV